VETSDNEAPLLEEEVDVSKIKAIAAVRAS
jgi:hypothetical protein